MTLWIRIMKREMQQEEQQLSVSLLVKQSVYLAFFFSSLAVSLVKTKASLRIESSLLISK